MFPDEFVKFVRTKPFRPYRIRLTDGRCHDIVHPDMAVLVGFGSLIVGVPAKDKQKPDVEEEILISLTHVTQVEFVEFPEAADSHNGKN